MRIHENFCRRLRFQMISFLSLSSLFASFVIANLQSDLLLAQEPDSDWKCNAILSNAKTYTVPDIGAGQGVALINNKLYFYGDKYDATPRVGVIKEYTLKMTPTGRTLLLNQNGKPKLTHPTGIAYLDKNNVFIGDTVNQKAKIYLLDWERGWLDGNLENAVKHVIIDDKMINGCRPLLVAANGRRFVASSDYGNAGNEIRLYDPSRLSVANTTSAEGVMVAKFNFGPFNQNLNWDAESGRITGVQNVTPGQGWRLQTMNSSLSELLKKLQPNRVSDNLGDMSNSTALTLPPHTELEGYCRLPNGKSLFLTAHKTNNVWIGELEKINSRETKPGVEIPYFND